MNATTTIPASILEMSIVRQAIAAVRIMWDVRNEKPLYNKMNWMHGIDSEYEQVLSMLFRSFAMDNETSNSFAKRIAGLK